MGNKPYTKQILTAENDRLKALNAKIMNDGIDQVDKRINVDKVNKILTIENNKLKEENSKLHKKLMKLHRCQK